MLERRFHLGIDYGTSTSKIVFRDYGGPGGDKAFVVASQNEYRIPSGIIVQSDKILLGKTARNLPQTPSDNVRLYESVKMRVGEEAIQNRRKFHYGPKPKFPNGFTARDFATLTVWWLISIGHRAAEPRLAYTGGGELVLGMTLGIPMSFYDDAAIRAEFLKIAQTAWRLYRQCEPLPDSGEISLQDARRILDHHYVTNTRVVPKQEIRDWIRSEAEAAMWWAFQSPSVSDGPFAQVDVGAGTTNASLFRIYSTLNSGRRAKQGLAFFAACSEPTGMDAIDELICERSAGPQPTSIRGAEEQLISAQAIQDRVSAFVKEHIWEAYRKTWSKTAQKVPPESAERSALRHHRVFLMGGGSLIRTVRGALPFHPSDNGHSEVRVQQLELPGDLYLSKPQSQSGPIAAAFKTLLRIQDKSYSQKPHIDDLPFLSVAYGLANIGIAIPEITTPDEMPTMISPSSRCKQLSHEDIYAR
jgi:hypothetical protein